MAHLQVVLVLGSSKYLHVDVPLHTIFLEGLLEHFVVLCKLIVVLSTPLDLTKVEGSWEDCVHYLAVHGASGTLLDLCNVSLKEVKMFK